MELYDVIIIGGGIAGLQASIQLGRYDRRVLVVDRGQGASTRCLKYRNILGWPDGVSGKDLRHIGIKQAEALGVSYVTENVTNVHRHSPERFQIATENGNTFEARRLLFATGVSDQNPFPQLEPCFGLSVYICPDCDGHEVENEPTLILGSGKAGVHMAERLHRWTSDLTYINHGKEPIRQQDQQKLNDLNVTYIEESILRPLVRNRQFRGVELQNGDSLQASHAFIAFGSIDVHSDLARKLGAERMENGHLITNARTKMTNVDHIWAAGDVGVHAEQVTIAMGEGTLALFGLRNRSENDKNRIIARL
ncbi:LOW QUALITY PROTEIN: thioredoxin reductase [Geomicrobium sp. JCM 19039]|nr:LOW QUALITY PROTEIN: thioredoxin reductase [Geomicrobium sp. JCM 19039]